VTNPIIDLRDAAIAAGGAIEGVASCEQYNGEEFADLAQTAIRRRARGCSMWVRIYGASRQNEQPQGKDRADNLIHWIVACPDIEATSAADAALAMVWAVYDEICDTTLNLDWIWPLRYRDWTTVWQQQGCCVASLVTVTWFDMKAFR
jgi:hypothetical protein